MTSTAFEPTPAMDERLAVPYVPDDVGRNAPTVRLKAQVWPAGIVYGTVHDQANWLILNLNREALVAAHARGRDHGHDAHAPVRSHRAHPHLVKLVNRVLEILATHVTHAQGRSGGGPRP